MAILVTCGACGAKLRVRDEYLDKEVWCPSCKAPLTLTGERVLNHEVFISYSNKDKAVADAICATLEEKKIRCWIAPRDISAGNSWGGSIIEAIEDAQVMVLVYSGHSNLSPQVIREVERAVAKGLLIVPFRIEAAPMSKDMEYFLSSSHWFDALTPPLEKHLAQFAEMVRLILFKNAKGKVALDPNSISAPVSRTNRLPWLVAVLAVITAILIIGAALWMHQYHQRAAANKASAMAPVATPSPAAASIPPDTAGAGKEKARVEVLTSTQPSRPTPMAVLPSDTARAFTNSIGMRLILIDPTRNPDGGRFLMGSAANESGRDEMRRDHFSDDPNSTREPLPVGDQEKQHWVRLTKPYYLGATEVTQDQWDKVMGTQPRPRRADGPDYPVSVQGHSAAEFVRKLSALPVEQAGGRLYRLPTEAEWEYACRAGSTTAYCYGDGAGKLGDYAWFIDNSGDRPHPVAQKQPNAWGFFDIHGNLQEWCRDRYALYPAEEQTDPVVDITDPVGRDVPYDQGETVRVVRGGSCLMPAHKCRSAWRFRNPTRTVWTVAGAPGISLRVAITAGNMMLAPSAQPAATTRANALVPVASTPTNKMTTLSEVGGVSKAMELFYDFSSPKQLEDFEVDGGNWEVKEGALVGVGKKGFGLRLRRRLEGEISVSWEQSQHRPSELGELTAKDDVHGGLQLGELASTHGFGKSYWVDSHFPPVASKPSPQYEAVCMLRALYRVSERSLACPDITGRRDKFILLDQPLRLQLDVEYRSSGTHVLLHDRDWKIENNEHFEIKPHFLKLVGSACMVKYRNLRIRFGKAAISPSAAATTATTPSQVTAPATTLAPTVGGAQPGQPLMTSIGMELVYIPPGEFMLGSTPEEQAWAKANGCDTRSTAREGAQPRKAAIKQGFWLGKTEVTVGQWKQFAVAADYVTDREQKGDKGSNWKALDFGFKLMDNHPVCCISWNDAVAFCEWLNEREQKEGRLLPGYKIRLPTEAEWEYACRAGKQTKFWWGETKEGGDNRLNWSGKGDGFEFVSPVDHYGSLGRNKFDLADMLGNVAEWCLDAYDAKQAHEECYKSNVGGRVSRGGSFYGNDRCASRYGGLSPFYSRGDSGFRVCVGMER